jgi:hypothetical protein
MTGKFRYLCDRTRPDILVAVGEISTGGSEGPSDLHKKVAVQIYNYLKCTPKLGMKLGGGSKRIVHFAMSDARWLPKKSRLGGCQWIDTDSGAIDCFSTNETTVSHSSMESEIKALDIMILRVIYVRNLLEFLGLGVAEPTTIFIDNEAAIELCKTLKTNQKSKHIQLRINYLRECINQRLISLEWIPSEDNVADGLTKPLHWIKMKSHMKKIMEGFDGDISNITSKSTSLNVLVTSI